MMAVWTSNFSSPNLFSLRTQRACSFLGLRSHSQVLDVRSIDASEVGLTAGSAANLIAVDAQRLMDTAGSLHELWGLPLQVYTY